MSVHIAETTVDPQGRVVLDHVPFHPGEKVDVILRSREIHTTGPADLLGSVVRYENPAEPVAIEDWAIQP